MKAILNLWDTHMQRGTMSSVFLGAFATIVLAASAAIGGGDLYSAAGFGGLGLVLTWREYLLWRRRKDQNGIELIGTEEKLLG